MRLEDLAKESQLYAKAASQLKAFHAYQKLPLVSAKSQAQAAASSAYVALRSIAATKYNPHALGKLVVFTHVCTGIKCSVPGSTM